MCTLMAPVVRGVRSSHPLSSRGSVTVEQQSWYAPPYTPLRHPLYTACATYALHLQQRSLLELATPNSYRHHVQKSTLSLAMHAASRFLLLSRASPHPVIPVQVLTRLCMTHTHR